MAFKVLLVEDDNNLREIYEARLQAEGYDIVTARDGEEALGVAKAEVPDLVISDVMMPRVSGFEMLDILRNTDALKDVKVIMLTALGQADDKTRANSLGADRYLVKSQVTLEDIVKTAHELLGDSSPEATATPAPNAAPAAAAPAVTPVVPAPVVAAAAPSPAGAPAAVPASPVTPQPTTFSPTVSPSQPPVAPAPPQAAAAPVAPAPSMPPLPGAAPTAAPAPAPMPTPAPVAATPTAPSTSEEQATVASQINNFIQTAPDTTPVAEPSGPAAQDDVVLADAMHDLAESAKPESEVSSTAPTIPQLSVAPAAPVPPATPSVSPDPAANPMPPIAPAPAPQPLTIAPRPMTQPNTPVAPAQAENKPVATTGSVPIANKKIIQPLSDAEAKPDIRELAAREEASNTASGPGATPPAATSFSPTMPTPPVPPAGPVVGGPGAAPAPQPPQAPPASPNGFDPNSISL